jgi:DNA-binding response OmpR family regulator
MARILIVGDQPNEVLDLVGHVLQQEGYAVKILDRRECDGNRIKGQGPDLLILNESSPLFDTARIYREVRGQRCFARLPVLVLTATGADLKLILPHVNGVIGRPLKPKVLVCRVRELLGREPSEDAEKQICVDDLVIDPVMHRATRNGILLPLSALEFRLLFYLASRGNAVCRRDELVQAVWDDPDAMHRSVDVAIRQLRKKIEKNPAKPILIHSVLKQGYTFRIK